MAKLNEAETARPKLKSIHLRLPENNLHVHRILLSY